MLSRALRAGRTNRSIWRATPGVLCWNTNEQRRIEGPPAPTVASVASFQYQARFASTELPSGSGGGEEQGGGKPQGSALRTGLLALGVGAGALYFFPGTIWNITLGTVALLVGRAVAVRAFHWPESKRPFLRRSFFLTIRRVVHGTVRHGTLTTFLSAAGATAAHRGITEGIDQILAMGAGVPKGLHANAFIVQSSRVVDDKLMITLESPVQMAGGSGRDDGRSGTADDDDAAIRGVAVVRTELVLRDVTPSGSAGSKDGVSVQLTAAELNKILQRSSFAQVSDAAVSIWEAFTGTGYDPEDTGESLLERVQQMRNGMGGSGQAGQPEVLHGYSKSTKGSRASGFSAGDDADAGANADGDGNEEEQDFATQFSTEMHDAVPLLEADVVSVEFAVRKTQADGSLGPVQEAALPANKSKPVTFGELLDGLSTEDGDAASLQDGVVTILKKKYDAYLAQNTGERVEDAIRFRSHTEAKSPGKRASARSSSQKGRIIDASFHERR